MRNIKKINNPKKSTYGYQVRVTRNGVEFSKFFSGLGRASQKRAVECRDGLIRALDDLPYGGHTYRSFAGDPLLLLV